MTNTTTYTNTNEILKGIASFILFMIAGACFFFVFGFVAFKVMESDPWYLTPHNTTSNALQFALAILWGFIWGVLFPLGMTSSGKSDSRYKNILTYIILWSAGTGVALWFCTFTYISFVLS